ncbi:MAG: hypothetical protein ACRDPL_12640, partial [Propionibacteriaceae bacterium]
LNPRALDPQIGGIGACISGKRASSSRPYRERAFRDGQWRPLGPDWAQVGARTSSMPSTVGLCSGPALRLAIGHPRPPLTATMRADW